ncbi:von Willebrand factor A domain-containing protein 3A isoform X2 [Nematostella vectensis]|uniref:von Willebrand factor A domain-containing protein 3A isoform X2 n=1 Tax=Nematostella vectensis TaxID=45351 RepID=UPI002077798E|nr:von Willebrand factor A domain-containing protein 3A isoform X2 [Nematostella vectensis]
MKKIFKVFKKSSSSSSSSSSSDEETEKDSKVSKPPPEKLAESPKGEPWRITHSDIEVERPPRHRPKSAKVKLKATADKSLSKEQESVPDDEPRGYHRFQKKPSERQHKVCHGTTKQRKCDMDTSSFSDERMQPVERPAWEMLQTVNAVPPRALTVTSVPQTKELMAVLGLEAAHAEGQSSSDWLARHSVDAQDLSYDEILKCGVPIKPPSDGDPDTAYIKYDAARLQDYEFKLNNVINLCQERIRWLLRGSRRAFGMVKGSHVGVLVDTSDANCGYGRLQLFQESLVGLINEQLVNKDQLFFVGFGTCAAPLWSVVRDVNCRIVDEALWWVNNLKQSGGCNLLGALKQVIKRRELDSIVVILGNTPDQNPKLISKYIHESTAGRNVQLHTVAYDCSVSSTNLFLKELAEQTKGRYHCYASTSDEQIMTGTDLSLVAAEMNKAMEVLRKVQEMRGHVAASTASNESLESLHDSKAVVRYAKGEFSQVSKYTSSSSPLVVEHPSFPARTSFDWLQQHGLKAKGLNLYQVLAPNAYSYVDGYISSINRNVQSRVHEMSMAQFEWHDGTVKNVHVDPTLLFDYQRHLESAVRLYRRRMEWLSVGCRKIFGTVVERRVVILVDMSICTSPAVLRLHEHIRLLLEQQMANKTSYNFICFGDKAEMFRPCMVEPSPEYLEATWKWLLQIGCKGSRNFLDAFRLAVENEEELKHGIEVDGIYVITSGVPDEPKDVVCGFMREALAGRNISLHTIFYEVDDEDGLIAIPGKFADREETAHTLKEMSHSVRGRFHWYRNGALIESDDLRAVINEMDRAFNYSQKTAMLLETVRKKKIEPVNTAFDNQLVPRPPSASKVKMALTPPRHTALTKARMTRPQTAGVEASPSPLSTGKKSRPLSASSQTKESSLKALCWKPSTARSSTTLIPTPPPSKNIIVKEKRPSSSVKASQQAFYTEFKNQTGAIFTQYPTSSMRKPRRPVPAAFIPDKEEVVTTREWMRHYSLAKLKLDLNNIVGTAECTHAKGKVQSIGQSVPARYCTIFPSVEVKGVVKHLHLLPHELDDYEEQVQRVMRRYVKRLQWLMSGSRRVFGTVVEKKVIILIDISGSMVASMEELKRELSALIWDQIRKTASMFNLVCFSSEAVPWSPSLVSVDDKSCQDAVEWVTSFEANGSTCTLDALQLAFEDPDVTGIYLLTDGKPDNSTTMVLREIAKLNSSRNVKIHCTSFNCDDSAANKFLQLLASQTGGRFHRCQGDTDGHVFAHRLLTEGFRDDEPLSMPSFEGDDLRRLGSEIASCRKFLMQARSYRALFPEPGKDDKRQQHPVSESTEVFHGPKRSSTSITVT